MEKIFDRGWAGSSFPLYVHLFFSSKIRTIKAFNVYRRRPEGGGDIGVLCVGP